MTRFVQVQLQSEIVYVSQMIVMSGCDTVILKLKSFQNLMFDPTWKLSYFQICNQFVIEFTMLYSIWLSKVRWNSIGMFHSTRIESKTICLGIHLFTSRGVVGSCSACGDDDNSFFFSLFIVDVVDVHVVIPFCPLLLL